MQQLYQISGISSQNSANDIFVSADDTNVTVYTDFMKGTSPCHPEHRRGISRNADSVLHEMSRQARHDTGYTHQREVSGVLTDAVSARAA